MADGETLGAEEESLWYLRRLDGGLFTLQTVDYIIAWITMEDDGVSCSHCFFMFCVIKLTSGAITRQANDESKRQIAAGYRQDVADLPRQRR